MCVSATSERTVAPSLLRVRALGAAVGLTLVISSLSGAGIRPARASLPHQDQAAQCGVDACPADLTGLDPEQRAICDPQDWAMKQIGMRRVWEDQVMRTLTGRGVKIAHIDTGYTVHPALPRAGGTEEGASAASSEFCRPFGALPDLSWGAHGVVPEEGFDFEAGCTDRQQCGPREPNARRDPHDPLVPAHFLFDRQPGHGTGTLGMITAPGVCLPGKPQKADRFLIGVAPGAKVIPFRVANGVIITEGRATRVVEALLNAVTTQVPAIEDGRTVYRPSVDVVTISHGRRSPSGEIEEAILTAERNGVIVVAASGEYPFFSPVRFPAQFPTVVGVTGTKVDGTPWSGIFGAGRGPSAKVAAPAYRVWHAETQVKKELECSTAVTGKGTSFSAPIVAGAAALWLEKYNRPEQGDTVGRLAKRYGYSAVPALFRYFLRPHDKKTLAGFRSPEELCRLAAEEKWPNEVDVCAHRRESWDVGHWGQGVLAVDKLLSAAYPGEFPTPAELCRDVYLTEGIGTWNRACPIGSPGRQTDETQTAGVVQEAKPAQEPEERWTRLAGASFGRPFGSHAGLGPALDYGIIFSRHYYHSPRGLLLQVQYAQGGNVGVGLGFGCGLGYDPYRDSKRSWSVIPGFGPAVSLGVKAAYLRAQTGTPGHSNLVGAQAQVAVLKIKASFGMFRDLDNHRWRSTWDLGVGY